MYKIVVYIPELYLDVVKNAMFSAGAGRLGHYERCCWEVLGTGQFNAMEGSNPFIGKVAELEVVAEYRVEMMCDVGVVKTVIAEMKKAHPYEHPAYDVMKLEDL